MAHRQGQGAIEYILLAACFIAFLIVFLSSNGPMHRSIDDNVNKAVDMIGDMALATNFDLGVIPEPPTPPSSANCGKWPSAAGCAHEIGEDGSRCWWRIEYKYENSQCVAMPAGKCVLRSSASLLAFTCCKGCSQEHYDCKVTKDYGCEQSSAFSGSSFKCSNPSSPCDLPPPPPIDCSQAPEGLCGASSGFEACFKFMKRKYLGFCTDTFAGCYDHVYDITGQGYQISCTGQVCYCTDAPALCAPNASVPCCDATSTTPGCYNP